MLCGTNFLECSRDKTEYKTNCDTFIVCNHCLNGRTKDYKGCCTNPKLIFVNQPNINGTPYKKQFCENCGSTFKAIKFDHPKEYLELPLLTKEVQQTIIEKRNIKVKKFREWIDERRRTETSPLEQEYNDRYNAYLKTPEWKCKREKVLKRDNFICQGCLDNKATQVHHITYQNIYNEPLFDLVSVCDSCHHSIHFPNQD